MSRKFSEEIEAELGDLKRLIFKRPISKDALVLVKDSMDRAIRESPESRSGLFARYLRAGACEDGILGNRDVDAAMKDYAFIMEHDSELRSEGMVDYARLFYWQDGDGSRNAVKALAWCEEAVSLDSNVRAMMLAGYISDHAMDDLESAARWYLSAFKHKLPWGLRFYASVQFRRGKYFSSVFSHIAATMVSPFMVLRYGKRDAFR